MLRLNPGDRLESVVCDTHVIVIRAPQEPVDLRCGGAPMVKVGGAGDAGLVPVGPHDSGTLLGKRYALGVPVIELLCTRSGRGSLSVGDIPVLVRETKPLPATD